ncbi:HPr kinase/phosphorylase [Proteiniborus sp. DW1]|uniref:HPr(Ser) kinase/phosphatase n=1 Tax=Proteiniborus sp. DW1 TaxID=1889883 RepID=UPI00092DEBEC|nr:HPr(Ser) kinase/phosphatase [Proteiniborus sp. DW1]SCG83879.1 HPr kinase/phosphorylase [Proteiniborus sp. DW1]
MRSVSIDKLVQDLGLEVIYKPKNSVSEITRNEINRLGLQIAGFFKYFGYKRIQIIGNAEWHFLQGMEKDIRARRIDSIFQYPIPAVVLTRNLEVFDEILMAAEKYDKNVLRTDMVTTKFTNRLVNYLDEALAPQITMHGVLVEVYGMGILLTGESGVGKSETALELVKRGHRLVADDAVQVKKVGEDLLIGESPDLIRYFLEIRGLGILDIERLYGTGAVKKWEAIDLVVQLEDWDPKKEYDRLGLDDEYIDILGKKVPKLTMPVRPGRNVAMILEVATRNTRQKQFGYNAAMELDRRMKEEYEKKKQAENRQGQY